MPIGHIRNILDQGKVPLLILENEQGKPMVQIEGDGSINLDPSMDQDGAVLEFWQSVSDFIPGEEAEIVENKVLLIKTFGLFDKLERAIDFGKLDRETIEELQTLKQDLKDYFYRA